MADKKTIEEQFYELNEIVTKMQSQDITLEQSFALYKQGLEMVRDCNQQIDKIEKDMKILEEDRSDV